MNKDAKSLSLSLFFFFGCTPGMWKFLGQGSNWSHSSDNTVHNCWVTRELQKSYKISKENLGSSCGSSGVMNPSSIYKDVGSIPGPAEWVKDPALP